MVYIFGTLTGIKEIIVLVPVLFHPKKVAKKLLEPTYCFVLGKLKKLLRGIYKEVALGSKAELI